MNSPGSHPRMTLVTRWLAVQTGCSPSPLPQGDHTSSQADPLLDQADHGPECNPNVTSCNPDENPAANTENPSKVFTVATNGDIRIPRDDSKSHKENLSDNVTFAPEEHTPGDTKFFTQAISLPPHMRPSPFIDGNTVWMLHPDHLESRYDTYGNPWGPMKMSYTIRYYPDIDPANSKAA